MHIPASALSWKDDLFLIVFAFLVKNDLLPDDLNDLGMCPLGNDLRKLVGIVKTVLKNTDLDQFPRRPPP